MRSLENRIDRLEQFMGNDTEKNQIVIERWFVDPSMMEYDPESGEGDLGSMEKTLFSRRTPGQPIEFF